MTRTGTASVLVAAYQAEHWLEACIESIQVQQLPVGWQLEILLGIDGCPRTAEASLALDRQHLTILKLDNNRGTYVTFNTLMQVATGDRICRFDADDVMWPNYLSRLIEKTHTVDIGFCWSIYTDDTLKPTSHVMAHEYYHPEEGKNRRRSDGCFMMRRQVWEALGGFRPWRCAADTDFIQRAEACGFSMGLVEEFLFYRRTHIDSLTVHPDTNFKSKLRQQYQTFITDHQAIYLDSSQALKVDAVTAETFEYV